jgi:retron-type reverse transcriptase
MGVPQGSPISPLYSNIYLNLHDRVWHSRGYPEKLGATLHRYADDVILVCRKSAAQALEAFELRRYLNYRSKRRGFGWKEFPNKKLYVMGIIYIGSGFIRYEGATVNAL